MLFLLWLPLPLPVPFMAKILFAFDIKGRCCLCAPAPAPALAAKCFVCTRIRIPIPLPFPIVVACLIFINKLKNKITRRHSQAGLLPGLDRQRRADGLLDIWLLLHPVLHHRCPAELLAKESLPDRYDPD